MAEFIYTPQVTYYEPGRGAVYVREYLRYTASETETAYNLNILTIGIEFQSPKVGTRFTLSSGSWAHKNVEFNGIEHNSTASRTYNTALTVDQANTWQRNKLVDMEYSYSISKTTSAIPISITFNGIALLQNLKTSQTSSNYIVEAYFDSAATITVPALKSYTVSLNANGGTNGSVTSFTKYYGINAAFPSASQSPTKTGYTFLGWGTSQTATSIVYSSGAAYTANSGGAFYAIWRKQLTFTYNANGGSGAPASSAHYLYNSDIGVSFTISNTAPTRPGYIFKGWSKSSTATTSSYSPGSRITISQDTTIYAVWQPDDTLDVSTSTSTTGYQVNVTTNSDISRTVNVYENGTLISTASVKGTYTGFKFTNKRPGTSYTVKVDLLEGSTVIASKTFAVVTSAVNLTLTGSDTDSTYTSCKATLSGMESSSAYSKKVIWRYALSSSPNSQTTFDERAIAASAASDVVTITGLIPGRTYNVIANYYVNDGLTVTKTISLSTKAIGGALSLETRSVSAVNVLLSGLAAVDYNIRADFYYKKASDTAWILAQTNDIYSNAQADLRATFTALTQSTTYNVKAEIIRSSDSAVISTLTLDVTTKAYVPGEAPTPYIDGYILVPHSKLLLIKQHVEGNMDGFTLMLKELLPNGGSETRGSGIPVNKNIIVHKDTEQSRGYQLVMIDGNGNEHNPSNAIQVKFSNISFVSYSKNEPAIISADYAYTVASALLKGYELLKEEDSITKALTERYESLKTSISEAVPGYPVKGRQSWVGNDFPVIHSIARLGASISGSGDISSPSSGSKMYYSWVNNAFNRARSALEYLEEEYK